MSFLQWLSIFLQFHLIKSFGYIETVTASGCESCRLLLTCRGLSPVIAILRADFVGSKTEIYQNEISTTAIDPLLPLQKLNYRCSGLNHCSFILKEDCPECQLWGAGNITVQYHCISEDRITRHCNQEIKLADLNEKGIYDGYVHNPGYPRFYTGKECRWKITAPPGQKIKLTITDLSLYVSYADLQHGIEQDVLEIIDGDQVIRSVTDQEYPPLTVVSPSESLDVVLKSSQYFIGRRGVFFQYATVGCQRPYIPEDGYLVYRNETTAQINCCVGFEFPDTGDRKRILKCLGAFWNETVPDRCERIASKKKAGLSSIKIGEEMGSEFIAPALLILALFIVNGFVLLYIYRVRKRNTMEIKDEELGTLTSTTPQEEPK